MSGDCGHGWGFEGPNGCERCNENEARQKVLIENSPQVASLRAEVESLKAQLAKKSLQFDMMEREAATQERFRKAAEEQLAEAQNTERLLRTNLGLYMDDCRRHIKRAVSAEEQLRVARETIRDLLAIRSTTPQEVVDARRAAALSVSAPKAEECGDCGGSGDRGLGNQYEACPHPSQATPVCDDVTLMKVAEAVRRWTGARAGFTKAEWEAALPGLVAEAKR